MALRVIEEGPEALDSYADVPIRFVVRVRYEVAGLTLTEVAVNPAYEYDYDALDHPKRWREWDLGTWRFFAALEGTTRIGAAAVALRTPGLDLLEGRADLACLWDIRVAPAWRGRGAGARLFEAAKAWAAQNGATELKVETQDINVPACRFYAKQGCRLVAAHPGVYERLPHQVQLLWSTRL